MYIKKNVNVSKLKSCWLFALKLKFLKASIRYTVVEWKQKCIVRALKRL